jgi:metallophosphoesterase superfamily enzyme
MNEAKSMAAKAQPETVALFVSDLHLHAGMPRTTDAFFRFLQTEATRTSSLYLLGDIFEYWAGDDDLQTPFNRKLCDALRLLSERGVKLHWIAGNRDFLVGPVFADEAGLTLLHEPHIAEFTHQKRNVPTIPLTWDFASRCAILHGSSPFSQNRWPSARRSSRACGKAVALRNKRSLWRSWMSIPQRLSACSAPMV